MPKKLWYVIIDDTIEEHHPHHQRATPTLLRNNTLDYSLSSQDLLMILMLGKKEVKLVRLHTMKNKKEKRTCTIFTINFDLQNNCMFFSNQHVQSQFNI
jgi:hypothetical protein